MRKKRPIGTNENGHHTIISKLWKKGRKNKTKRVWWSGTILGEEKRRSQVCRSSFFAGCLPIQFNTYAPGPSHLHSCRPCSSWTETASRRRNSSFCDRASKPKKTIFRLRLNFTNYSIILPSPYFPRRVPGTWRFDHALAASFPIVALRGQFRCSLPHRHQSHVLPATIHRPKRSLHAIYHHAWKVAHGLADHHPDLGRNRIMFCKSVVSACQQKYIP